VVERDEFINQAREVEQIDLGDTLDLPADEVTLTISALVSSGALEEEMIRMNIDLDGPARIGYRQINSDLRAIGKLQVRDLWDDRYAPSSQRISEHHLWMRLGSGTIATVDEAADETERSAPTWVAQTPSNLCKLGH
jgi:hypothetical protein